MTRPRPSSPSAVGRRRSCWYLSLLILCMFRLEAAEQSRYAVGCPFGRASLFVNHQSLIQSGAIYDINYGFRFHPLLNLEFSFGYFGVHTPVTGAQDDMSLFCKAKIIALTEQIHVLRFRRSFIFLFAGLEYTFYSFDTEDQAAVMALLPEPVTNIKENERVNLAKTGALGGRLGMGIEFSLGGKLALSVEGGYRLSRFSTEAIWTDKEDLVHTVPINDIKGNGWLLSVGFKAYLGR